MFVQIVDGLLVVFFSIWSKFWNFVLMDGEVIVGVWLLNGFFEMDQGWWGFYGKVSDKVEEFCN